MEVARPIIKTSLLASCGILSMSAPRLLLPLRPAIVSIHRPGRLQLFGLALRYQLTLTQIIKHALTHVAAAARIIYGLTAVGGVWET